MYRTVFNFTLPITGCTVLWNPVLELKTTIIPTNEQEGSPSKYIIQFEHNSVYLNSLCYINRTNNNDLEKLYNSNGRIEY